MSELDFSCALIIDSDEAAAQSVATALAPSLEQLNLEPVALVAADVQAYLQQQMNEVFPALVVLGPQLQHVAALTRELAARSKESHFFYLYSPAKQEQFQRQFQYVPRANLHWSSAAVDANDVLELLQNALAATRQRLQFHRSLDRANSQIRGMQREKKPRRVSDHYLANILAQAQDAIVAINPEYRVLYWSAGAERLFGRSRRDVVGMFVQDLPLWTPRLQAYLAQLRQDQQTINTELTMNGGELTVDVVISAVVDEEGVFIGASLAMRDISERVRRLTAERLERNRAARELDDERRHLRTLFHQAPGFIAVMAGAKHRFEVANDAYYQLIGHRSILGKPVAEALPEVQGQRFLALLDQVFRNGEPYVGRSIPVGIQRKPGAELETVYVDFVYQPILDADGTVTGIFCQGTDVTEHKRTQEKLAVHQSELESLVAERTKALEASQQALQRSQKLEAVGQLTGGVAHDFNNVLQIISGNLQLLQLELSGTQQLERYLKSAVDAVERGAKLSSQLLAFARRQPLQPLPINLSRVLRDMDDLLRRALGETIEVECVVGGGLWNALVDPHQLENVILNLAINARDAMPEGGKLTLELGNALLDDHYVMAEADIPAGQYVMLAISDTGKGMPPDVLERAFDPFFSTKPEGEGTGLGLSMAYGFVKQSGGHIKIYSEVNQGTTFRIYLPRCFEAEAEASITLTGPVIGGSETILVVEDDQAVQETAVRLLIDLGYKVLKAVDGESALTVLQSGVAIDMLFTDVVMPGTLRSPELAKKAKQLMPDIVVLFTSGYTQNAIVHGGRLDPGVELLSKPYRREDLARKIRFLLNQKRAAAKSAAKALPEKTAEPRRILVVEDDVESQAAVCDLLKLLGHHATGVASAEAALVALQEGRYDLLFTDINLPGMSGTDLAKQARETRPNLNIIIASGYGSVPADIKAFAIVLTKPFGLTQLREALMALSR